MHGGVRYMPCLGLLLGVTLLFCGCASQADAGKKEAPETVRETVTELLLPKAEGQVTDGNESVSIDASHTEEGYVMVRWEGGDARVRVQIQLPGGDTSTYVLETGAYQVFPLTGGDGLYRVDVLENAYGDMYALSFSQELSVSLRDEFRPYLYPNQYAWYDEGSRTVALGRELSAQSADDLDYVDRVYAYVTENVVYDTVAAQNISTNYIPQADVTLSTKKGICFDYASLATALLRSQGIPTRLEVGYSGTAYHAWISVYLEESGWVDRVIEFNGDSWNLLDPTLAASNDRKSVEKYIGDGRNYTVKYFY